MDRAAAVSGQRAPLLQGWGQTDPGSGTWRRNRDWIGRHTIAAAVLGAAFAALLGYAITEFAPGLSATPRGDVRAVEQAAMRESFEASYEAALAEAIAAVRVAALADEVVYAERGGGAEWALGFRDGWAKGWNEALAAMRAASEAAGLPPNAPEFYILDGAQAR